MWRVSTAPLILLAVLANAADLKEQVYDLPEEEYSDDLKLLDIAPLAKHVSSKRDMDGGMPGVLRFGKREGFAEKEVPGVLRFGKRSNKKSVPGVLRFGKRNVPGVLRFGKREIPGVLRFGKRSAPVVFRYNKRQNIPGVMRFGKRAMYDVIPLELLDKKSVPGVLRFGK
uniref:FMRFamide-like prepropeptide n=1 Tax=Oesophagostomum dentatum TaxID=61180 RepID=Q86QQ3_OESDE|nr:FMRFamide-like prepropeptide [Oesophagostomum dentatum]